MVLLMAVTAEATEEATEEAMVQVTVIAVPRIREYLRQLIL